MKPKKESECGFRKVRHAQEKRAYYAHKNKVHIRAKRSPRNLPDPYDDISSTIQKSWKVKRTKQYRNRSQLKEQTIITDDMCEKWDIENYFKKHNIPYRVKEYRKKFVRYVTPYKRVKDKYLPVYKYGSKKQIGWGWTYISVPDYDAPKKKYSYSILLYYTITYWR